MRSEANELKRLTLKNNLHWQESWINMRSRWVEVYIAWDKKEYPDDQLLIYIKNGKVVDCYEIAKTYPDDLYRSVCEYIERMAAKAAKGTEQKNH